MNESPTGFAHPPHGKLERAEILSWLYEDDPDKLGNLWQAADLVRRENVGDDVHLRGLIEIGNYCARRCAYCGINAGNHKITRYRMTIDEIFSSARLAVHFGYGSVVLQAGEDYGFSRGNIDEIISNIKSESSLAITLSLGERKIDELKAWKKAGADRYLLRFETSNSDLFHKVHPPIANHPGGSRIAILQELRDLGYELGSGVLIGIPGQSYEDLANDIELFRALDLDMIGVGPFIPHPDTPLGNTVLNTISPDQVPNSELMTYKVVALARLVCPRANIPSTTALATLNIDEGRELGLQRGANILMPNLTPPKYRRLYEIYPGKACIIESAEKCHSKTISQLAALGRTIGKGPGISLNYLSTAAGYENSRW